MKDEVKVVLCLLISLLIAEVAARVFETRLSKDVAHVAGLPEQSARMMEAGRQGDFKVLIIGNSLARCGVDVPLFTAGLERKLGRSVFVAAMTPDASGIAEWYYGWRRNFSEVRPDLILVLTGRTHLLDHMDNWPDLGAFYVSGSDLPGFSRRHIKGIESGFQFLAGVCSRLFAHRDRVEPLVFYNGVPGYEATLQSLQGFGSAGFDVNDVRNTQSCALFTMLVDEINRKAMNLIVVSVPLPKNYELPGCIRNHTHERGVELLDAGNGLRLAASYFPDGYHLNKEGASFFTDWILGRMMKQPEM